MPPSYWDGFGDRESSYSEMPMAAEDLWQHTINASPVWEGMSENQQLEMEQRFIDDLFIGDIVDIDMLLSDLDVYWDSQDWDDWRAAYGAVH